jgi:hypothetical protein
METMKIASLWRRQGNASQLKPELGRCDDAKLKELLRAFLGGGAVVLHAPGLREDRLDPSRTASVPLGYVTDGEWIWPLELAYYLEEHDILPQPELLDHARARQYRAGEPTKAQLAAASQLLTGSAGGPPGPSRPGPSGAS